MKCGSHLRQMGLAIQNYNDVHKRYPSGFTRFHSWGWAVMILPYLEQANLHNQLATDSGNWRPIDNGADPVLLSRLQTKIPLYRCPSDNAPDSNGKRLVGGRQFGLSNYAACNGSLLFQHLGEWYDAKARPATRPPMSAVTASSSWTARSTSATSRTAQATRSWLANGSTGFTMRPCGAGPQMSTVATPIATTISARRATRTWGAITRLTASMQMRTAAITRRRAVRLLRRLSAFSVADDQCLGRQRGDAVGRFRSPGRCVTTALASGRMNKRGRGNRILLQGPQLVGFVLWVLACAALGGCNNAKYGEVTGQVTLDGKPLPGVAVRFEDERGSSTIARTDKAGNYVLQYTVHQIGARSAAQGDDLYAGSRERRDWRAGQGRSRSGQIPPQLDDDRRSEAGEAGDRGFALTSK